MSNLKISVTLKGYSQELLTSLLSKAEEVEVPISEVRFTPLGLQVPVKLAQEAGLLPAPPAPKKAAAKRRGRPPKKETQPELPWDE